MLIALPTAEGKLCAHFGHCQAFALVSVGEDKTILGVETEPPPPHQPGLLPKWLNEKSVDLVIAGGMGMRAQELFTRHGIEVLVGAPPDEPEKIVADYLDGALRTGANLCDH